MNEGSEEESDEYQFERRQIRSKRRKVNYARAIPVKVPEISFQPLLDGLDDTEDTDAAFDDIMMYLLPDYLGTRAKLQDQMAEFDQQGHRVRPLTRSEVSSYIETAISGEPPETLDQRLVQRKLKLGRERRRAGLSELNIQASKVVTPPSPPPPTLPVHPQVIDALHSVQTTPFENSFLSRLQGTRATNLAGAIAVDWGTKPPWISLMTDVREHYVLSHPEREIHVEALAPVTYTTLQTCHLPQVDDLLERSFWKGINVDDSLDHSPERCTIVATYKKLVIGVAILSSPRETYITYLAVKAGWDNARIARSMLYHLIKLNPNKDITLHVSVNSSAMLLYNRFGFKAEEFVAGFYEDYLDPHSRASKNAFRLRLRQQ